MTFENYRPGRWRGDSSRNWESLHRFQFAEWHGGGRRTTAWISVMCLKPLHPEKPSPGFRYRVWCNVLSETTSLVWSDMTTRFILLSFGFLMNKKKWQSWSSVVGKGTRMLTPHRGILQTGLLRVGTVLMNSKKTLQMVPIVTDGY